MSILKILKNIFSKKEKRILKFKKVIFENNFSVKPQKNAITIVKKNNSFKWVKFKCPCGCGKEVTLSLNPSIKPYWEITMKKNKITLSPSVYLTGFPCNSHFFIRNNKIDWV
ncbi:DUF6527 family protein [Clostridium arbusti]|uniref:DUF6527 family protein n=1 Tax=Clostridium arbusti TaxID=1137848 RepID=UPI000288270C|nr:DUF6527 family protein [Clostridium arbusti]